MCVCVCVCDSFNNSLSVFTDCISSLITSFVSLSPCVFCFIHRFLSAQTNLHVMPIKKRNRSHWKGAGNEYLPPILLLREIALAARTMTSCSVNVIWLASESVYMWAFFFFFVGGQFISSGPVSPYYSLAEESTERGWERADRKGEERKRLREGVSGAITVVLVREETSIYLSLSEGIKTTFSLCHLIFSSPLSISRVTFLAVCSVSILISFVKCLQPPLFS